MRLYFLQEQSGQTAMAALEARGAASLDAVAQRVQTILDAVRAEGDVALGRYARQLDRLPEEAALRVSTVEMAAAWKALDPALQDALTTAAAQIRGFAEKQMPHSFDCSPVPGLTTGQRVRPLDAVGCYVPGGRHPLPSTMLMTVIPAQVAGVARIAVVSPYPAPETLAAAHMLGVTEFYRVGGAQAIAALAWGTQSIAPVRRIVGPGNLYVTAAKRAIAQQSRCSIDMLAGPTEIVVFSDSGNAQSIAADLVAQAEHDPAALAIFVTTEATLAEAVRCEAMRQAALNPVAEQALAANGYIFVAQTQAEARDLVNLLAPEHLTVDGAEDLQWIRNAGSIFVGKYSPQPMGDYISGPNHTLPTGGLAAQRGGLSVFDFLKLITVQEYTPKALARLGPQAVLLAQAEGLTGHAVAIAERLDTLNVLPAETDSAVLGNWPEPRVRVLRMPEYHPPLGNRDALRLDFNENTVACSSRVVEALAALTPADLTRYPERGPVEALAAERLSLSREQVVLTNGVDEAIHLLCQAYLDRGDELLLPTPTYTMYEIYAAGTDASVVRVQADADFRFPFEKLLAAITPRTRMIAIANPNSPTGSVATRDQLLAIAAAAPQAILLVDEAYFHFHGETLIDAIDKVPNLVIARTFSKAYGLAGLRLGLLASRVENLRWVRRVISPYCVNTAALIALRAALEDNAYLEEYVGEVLAAREEYVTQLNRLGLRHWPSAANFVLVEIGPEHKRFCARMKAAGVLVRDRSADPGCDGLVRITVGTRAQMSVSTAAMEAALTELNIGTQYTYGGER